MFPLPSAVARHHERHLDVSRSAGPSDRRLSPWTMKGISMSQIETYRETLKDYAKDIRLNLSSVLSPEGAPGLTDRQIRVVALACAFSTRTRALADAIRADSAGIIGDAEVEAAKSAATIMA